MPVALTRLPGEPPPAATVSAYQAEVVAIVGACEQYQQQVATVVSGGARATFGFGPPTTSTAENMLAAAIFQAHQAVTVACC